jgi:hypothetical protein
MDNNILDAESLPHYSEKAVSESDSLSMRSLKKYISKKYYSIQKGIKQKQPDFLRSVLPPYTVNWKNTD